MQKTINLSELKTPQDIRRLQAALEELFDVHDSVYTETAPNGSISAPRGKRAIYKNGSTYEFWENIDGDTTWQRIDAGASYKVGSFTRDISLASGTQAITGVGFQPKAIIFLMVIGADDIATWGLDDNITPVGIADQNAVAAGTWFNTADNAMSIKAYIAAGISYDGKVDSFDSDGFTMSWTKNGLPTGTITIHYLALR